MKLVESYADRKRRLAGEAPKRPSKVTIPERAHPLVRLVFQLCRDRNLTLQALSDRSGILTATGKAARVKNIPTTTTLAAWLGALDHHLVAAPMAHALDAELRTDLEAIAVKHGEKLEPLVAALIEVAAIGREFTAAGQERARRIAGTEFMARANLRASLMEVVHARRFAEQDRAATEIVA